MPTIAHPHATIADDLRAERERLTRRKEQLEAARSRGNFTLSDTGDRGQYAAERDQADQTIVQVRERMHAIGRALARIDDGTYGACVGCSSPIPLERLEVRPTAEECMNCASSRRVAA